MRPEPVQKSLHPDLRAAVLRLVGRLQLPADGTGMSRGRWHRGRDRGGRCDGRGGLLRRPEVLRWGMRDPLPLHRVRPDDLRRLSDRAGERLRDVRQRAVRLRVLQRVPQERPLLRAKLKRVFVTSSFYNGNFVGLTGLATGLDAADKLCSDAAVSLGGTWTAFVSGQNAASLATNAIDRLTGTGPWYLVDRATLAFANKTAVASGSLAGFAERSLTSSLLRRMSRP